jgi:hypothetical protein
MTYGSSETVPGKLLRFYTIFVVLDDPRPARHPLNFQVWPADLLYEWKAEKSET